MLNFINKYMNRIFYGFLIFHVALMIKVILIDANFDYFMTFKNQYETILTISNSMLIALLFLKGFMQEQSIGTGSFLQFVYRKKKIIIIGIVFFLLLITNDILEDKALFTLQHIHQNILPLHMIIYAITIFTGFSQYKDIFKEYHSFKDAPSIIFSELIKITKIEITELVLLSSFIAIAGKFNLANYLINYLDIAIILVLSTSAIIFIALFIIHKVKINKR